MSMVSGLTRVIVSLAIITTFSVMGYSNRCKCAMMTRCQSYTLSEKVFIGKFVKIINPDGSVSERIGVFEVIRTLKGKTSEREEVDFAVNCDGREFEVGEEYLVYSYPEPYRQYVCDYTDLLVNSAKDVELAKLLSSGPLLFSIEGRVGIPEGTDYLKGVRVEIESDERKETLSLDNDGRFQLSLKEPGKYNVSVKYPDGLDLTVHNLGFQQTAKECPFRYQVTVDRSGCDYREFLLGSLLSKEMWELKLSGR